MSRREFFSKPDFFAGLKAASPVMLSLAPFALITGAVSVRLGLSPLAACGLSLFVFAGTAQLTAIQLIHDAALPVVILLTVLFINLRFTMYSAALAPHFKRLGGWRKALAAYVLTDQAYIVSLFGFGQRPQLERKYSFYVGIALPLWTVWQTGTLVGALAGSLVPPDWGLDFAVPLTFLALLFPAVRDRPSAAAAIAGGAVAVLAHAMPWNLGLLLGTLAGIAVGVLVSERGNAGE